MHSQLTLIFILAAGTYLARFISLVKKEGLDPTLLTYASPLYAKGISVARITTALLIVVWWFWPKTAQLGLEVYGLYLVFHLFSLAVFARLPTQPAVYYLLATSLSLLLFVSHSHRLAWIAPLIAALAEAYYSYWQRHRATNYNAWVARQVIKIDKKYRHLTHALTAREQFTFLHIATTEAIARPAAVRLAERIYYLLFRPPVISTGIMQVAGPKPMSDSQSVQAALGIIKELLQRVPENLPPNEQLIWVAKHYNGSMSYSRYLNATYPGVHQAWLKLGP